MTDRDRVQVSSEPVEFRREKVTIHGFDDLFGMVTAIFSLPPFQRELRIRMTPFNNKNTDRYTDPHSFTLSSRQEALLLSKALKKTAELIDNYADKLPDKEKKDE